MRQYDVAVIGAGIHGAGVAQAVAAAGHKVLLIERKGLASGTSSRSSKLIHGGLRYLESGQFRLVRESLRERTVMLKVAADLVELKPFYIPIYRHTRRRPWQIKFGLALYALLGGFAVSTRFGTIPKPDWPALDGLCTDDLDAVIRYFDAQTDDAALTAAVVQSAQSLGTELAMPATFIEAESLPASVRVWFEQGGQMLECETRVLVNAAGPWATRVASGIRPKEPVPSVELVQGTHIVLPHPLQAGIYYVESPGDGRAIFLMPWRGGTMIGTTETPFKGEPDQVRPLVEEENYLLAIARIYFPAFRHYTRADITQRFAGLRVLPSSGTRAFGRSRETMFTTDRDPNPRVLGIFGGKLTAWRATAVHVLARIEASLPRTRRRATTDQLILRRPA
jgi:glycerol-3-phosphate dehydrogenase